MTVSELREAIDGLDPDTYVVVYLENERGTFFYDVAHASLSSGEPRRNATGRVGFCTADPAWFT